MKEDRISGPGNLCCLWREAGGEGLGMRREEGGYGGNKCWWGKISGRGNTEAKNRERNTLQLLGSAKCIKKRQIKEFFGSLHWLGHYFSNIKQLVLFSVYLFLFYLIFWLDGFATWYKLGLIYWRIILTKKFWFASIVIYEYLKYIRSCKHWNTLSKMEKRSLFLSHFLNNRFNETSGWEQYLYCRALRTIDWLLYNWRIFLSHYIGGFLPPSDSLISAVIFTRIIRIHI